MMIDGKFEDIVSFYSTISKKMTLFAELKKKQM